MSVLGTIRDGCILAVIIVFLFLNQWESTLISASSIPISIITTFICMKAMNFSLNTMSLMALSLAVGLLIDDAIVVIENIVQHLIWVHPQCKQLKKLLLKLDLQ